MVLVPQSGAKANEDYYPVQAQRGWSYFTHAAGSRLPRSLNRVGQIGRELRQMTGTRKHK